MSGRLIPSFANLYKEVEDLRLLKRKSAAASNQNLRPNEQDDLLRSYQSLKDDFEKVAKAESTMVKRNLKLMNELASLEEKLDIQEKAKISTIANLEAQLHAEREQKYAAECRVAEYLASTSWRVTAPLRSARSMAFRFKR